MRLMRDYRLSLKPNLFLLSFNLLCFGFILSTAQVKAQESSWQGGARGTAARVIGQRWKVGVSQADLYAGPSVAYSKRGRVYEGEQLTILEVTRSQEWAQVSAPSGIKAWIKVSALNRPQDQVAQDPGRYRRQQEYQYDAQGRRITNTGQAMGSGQGTGRQQQSRNELPKRQAQAREWQQRANPSSGFRERQDQTNLGDMSEADRLNNLARSRAFSRHDMGASPLNISLPVGISHFTRRFTSNIGTPPLSGLKTQVLSPNVGLILNSQITPYLHIAARYMKTMGAKAPLPSLAAFPEVGAVDLPTNQQTAELVVGFGTDLSFGWAESFGVKGLLGAQYYDSTFTPVQYPAPAERMAPLQDHRYISALLGLELSLKFKPMTLTLRGGGSLPLSFEQAPNSEGQWKSLGLWSQVQGDWHLNEHWSLGILCAYMRIATEYTGPAEQADYTLNQVVYYTQASGYDQNLEALLLVSYQL